MATARPSMLSCFGCYSKGKLMGLWLRLHNYKSATQKVTYNQLVHPMKTHNMGKVDEKTTVVVGGEELDDDYNRCILSPNNGRHPGGLPLKWIEPQTQDKKVRRYSKCGEVGHTRHTCHNGRADFDPTYEGDVVQIEKLLDEEQCDGTFRNYNFLMLYILILLLLWLQGLRAFFSDGGTLADTWLLWK